MMYTVTLGCKHFEFDNSDEAMLFAEMAIEHKNRDTDNDLEVAMSIEEREVSE